MRLFTHELRERRGELSAYTQPVTIRICARLISIPIFVIATTLTHVSGRRIYSLVKTKIDFLSPSTTFNDYKDD